ncbi:hypothetical protein [Streptomyces sp. 150FB]|uniref:LppU/SCO3897 family protein n=1 Tax=Streptomyces sp. 150FB TaxID=1576605 RepID=UPI001364B7BE|nr:hypothetical protein [Streptomyces sp. 150FB]
MSALPPPQAPIEPAKYAKYNMRANMSADERLRRGRLVLLGLVVVVVGLVAFSVFGPHDQKDGAPVLKAGDCFQNTGTDKEPEAKKLACGDSAAQYKVLKSIKGGVTSLACSDVAGTTGALTQVGAESFVVCFEANQ